jgi:hypothetical protein
MQRPDIEGHILKQALRQHVIGMIMGVDEAGDDELAARLDRFGGDTFRFHVLARRRHRGDARTHDQDVADRRIVDIAIMVVDACAADQQRAFARFHHTRELCL